MNTELIVVWRGDTWRDFPQPQVGLMIPTRSLIEEVRAYLQARAGCWRTSQHIAEYCGVSGQEIKDRLRQLRTRGEIQAQRRQLSPGDCERWVYRIPAAAPVTAMPKRRSRKARRIRAAWEGQAMRARLARAS